MTILKGLKKLLTVFVLVCQGVSWAQPGPDLITPENDLQDVEWENVSFNWSMIDSAVIYQIEIDVQGDFESPFFTEFAENNFIDVTELFSNWRFNWRVRAGFASDTAEYHFTQWSEVYAFNTIYLAPENNIPPDSSAGEDYNEVQLEWQLDLDPQISTAENLYKVQVARDDGFADIVHEEMEINETFTSVSDLETATRYFWRVQYYNQHGFSDWSVPTSFMTLPADIEQVVLLYPENNQTAVNPDNIIFSWDEVSAAQSYNIEIARDSLFLSMLESSVVFSTEYMTGISLFGTKIYWRVQASSTDGDGPWSVVWSFETSITAPQTPPALLSPADSSSGYSAGNLEFEWRGVQGAVSYAVEVSAGRLFTELLAAESAFDTSIVLNLDLQDGNYYYWRVQAENDSGAGPWSEIWSFYAGTVSAIDGNPLFAAHFDLQQNFPNPFNPSTTIRFQIAVLSQVRINIYNVLGQHVQTLLNESRSPGEYELVWDGLNTFNQSTASGVYFYVMEAVTEQGQHFSKSYKMLKLQ